MMRNCQFLILALAFLLCGCFEERTPSGYEAVAAVDDGQTHSQCPDLTGSFDLSGTPLGRAITDETAPETKGLPVLMTFKKGVINTEAWWVVPMDSLQQWAEKERQQNPQRYSRWYELVLHPPSRSKPWSDLVAFRESLAKLGPPAGAVFAGMVGNHCSENWMEIRNQPGYRGTPTNPDAEGMGEKEIWLARDQNGALLMKTIYFAVKPFHVWGDSSNTIRTSSSTTWSKVEASSYADPMPLTPSDLPAAVPLSELPTCDELMYRLAAVSNRIIGSTPPGVMVVYSMAQSDASNALLKECEGKGKLLELHLIGKDPDQLASVDGQILIDPAVESVSVLHEPGDKPSLRKLKIVLK